MFEDIKGVIKIRKWKKDRHHNDQKKTDKRTNNDLQSTTQEYKDWVTQTPLKTEGELRLYVRVSSSKLFRKNDAMWWVYGEMCLTTASKKREDNGYSKEIMPRKISSYQAILH